MEDFCEIEVWVRGFFLVIRFLFYYFKDLVFGVKNKCFKNELVYNI